MRILTEDELSKLERLNRSPEFLRASTVQALIENCRAMRRVIARFRSAFIIHLAPHTQEAVRIWESTITNANLNPDDFTED